MLYQQPTRVSRTAASIAARANHPMACCPNGMTIAAARSGPMALPPFPPTWKMDWARLFFPPEASWATLDASGWKTDEPHPMTATDARISMKLDE